MNLIYLLNIVFAYATLSGSLNDAHSIHFPGATRRTLRISTSTATSVNAILILYNYSVQKINFTTILKK